MPQRGADGVRNGGVVAYGRGRTPGPGGKEPAVLRVLLAVVVVLFAAWVLLGVLGWVVKGLFWLAVVGIVVLVGSSLLESTRRRH